MTLKTRKPTGKPPWPIMLLAGGEKAGKSYAAAQASASDLVGRTFWIGIGEDDPDEYGAIEGARFDIVQHDGTWRGIANAIYAATQEPAEGAPNMIVIDSATRLWELLSDEAQVKANERAKKAAQKYKREYDPDAEATIGPDLWNKATDRWNTIIGLLRNHEGPSLVTARMEQVTVMDKDGKPTKDKVSKIKAQKNLPYDVGVIVEMPTRGETYISGLRSLKFDVRLDERKSLPDFTADGLWRRMGLDVEGATSPRQYSEADGKKSAEDGQNTDSKPSVKPWDMSNAQNAIKLARGDVDALKKAWTTANESGAPADVLDAIKGAAQPKDKVHEGTLV